MFLDGGQMNLNYTDYQKKIIGSRRTDNSSNNKNYKNSFKPFDLFAKKNKLNSDQLNSIKANLTKSVNRFVSTITAQLTGQQLQQQQQQNNNSNNYKPMNSITGINNNNNNNNSSSSKKKNKVSDSRQQQQPTQNNLLVNKNDSIRSDGTTGPALSIRNRMHPFNRSMEYCNNNTSGAKLNNTYPQSHDTTSTNVKSKNLLQRSFSNKQMRTTEYSNNLLIKPSDQLNNPLTTLRKNKSFVEKKNSSNNLFSTNSFTRKKIVNSCGASLKSPSFNKSNNPTNNNWLTKTTAVIFSIINLLLLLSAQPFLLSTITISVEAAPLQIKRINYDTLPLEDIADIIDLNGGHERFIKIEDNVPATFLLIDKNAADANLPEDDDDDHDNIKLDQQVTNSEDKQQDDIADLISQESSSRDDVDSVNDDEELLWIQRRRLNRDRALEPPPWFREQPMRRGGGLNVLSSPASSFQTPAITSSSSDKTDDEIASSKLASNYVEQEKSLQGEQSLMTPDDDESNAGPTSKEPKLTDSKDDRSYEILKQLLFEVSNDKDFLDDLYNEIQLRRQKERGQVQAARKKLREQQQQQEPFGFYSRDDRNRVVTPFDALESLKGLVKTEQQLQEIKQLASDDSNNSKEDEQSSDDKLAAASALKEALSMEPIMMGSGNLANERQADDSDIHSSNNNSDLEERLLDELDLANDKIIKKQVETRNELRKSRYMNLMKRSTGINNKGNFYQIISPSQQQTADTVVERSIDNNTPSFDLGSLDTEQLALIATKIKSSIEDKLDLHRGLVLGLYPLDSEKLLVKLDSKRLRRAELLDMIENYDYARGFIVMDWSKERNQNPVPLLTAILRAWISPNYSGGSSTSAENDLFSGADSLPLASVNLEGEENAYQELLSQPKLAEQLSEVELLQSSLASPNFIVLDDKEPPTDEEAGIDVSDVEEPDNINNQDIIAYYEPSLNNDNKLRLNSNTDRLKFTRSIGNQNDLLASGYNDQRSPIKTSGGGFGNVRQKPMESKKLTPLERLSLAKEGGFPNEKSYSKLLNLDQQPLILKDRLLFNKLLMNNYLSAFYNGAGPTSADYNLIEMLPAGGAVTGTKSMTAKSMKSKEKPISDQQNEQQHNKGAGNFDYWTNKIYHNNHTVHLFALMAAILASCLAIKFVLKGSSLESGERASLFRRNFRRFGNSNSGSSFRSLWSRSRSESTISGEVEGEVTEKHNKQLNRANLTDGRLSTTSSSLNQKEACDGSSHHESAKFGGTKSLDILTQKLIWLLKSNQEQAKAETKKAPGNLKEGEALNDHDDADKKKTINSEIIEVDSVSNTNLDEFKTNEDNEQVDENSPYGSHFRSSRSYIKSLIDVLSNARSHMPNVVPQFGAPSNRGNVGQIIICGDDEDDNDSELLLSTTTTANKMDTDCTLNSENQLEEPGIVMSQMDISAAHLILAYMEKHLEDKERLKREWLELNSAYQQQQAANKQGKQLPSSGASGSSQVAPGLLHQTDGNKIKQLMLERLAKVALNDENKTKNRNPLVVPFDRNRVRLFGRSMNPCCSPPHSSSTPSSSSLSFSSLQRSSRNSASTSKQLIGANNKNNKKLQHRRSDYINASYIYDDDPRRPTHIIAQGPTEQTVAQFWQMIWEQGISVIVMLTRLNENSIRMCQCYWPTSVVQMPNQTTPTTGNNTDTNNINSRQPLDVPFIADSAPTAAKSTSTTTPPTGTTATTANGRRGSVTSVFNGPALRLVNANGTNNSSNNNNWANFTTNNNINTSGQPTIIANGDLTNNVLIFDISCNNSFDEEDEQQQRQKDNNFKSNDKLDTGAKMRLEVHLVSEHVSSNDYLVRNMYMINRSTGETRTVTQFHYLSWPLNGVPENAKSLLSFRRKVHKSYRNLKSPILVHCSDGAGRSGTYTLIDIILERIKNGAKEIDPRATLEHLRDQRIGLCSTQSQFEFVLVALAEEIQLILNALPQ